MSIRHLTLLAVLILAACGYTKEYIPISSQAVGPRLPNQQRLVATAVTQAVQAAAPGINFAQYAGKVGQVDVDGVFPHSREDLLDYVGSAVEWEMAKAGMLVIPRRKGEHHVDVKVRAESATPAPEKEGDHKKADVRVIASLDWAGIDYTDKKYVLEGKVAGMVVVGVFTFGLGAIIWAVADKPFAHMFTLDGRARLTLRVIPRVAGISPAQSSGEGTSRVVIDSESSSGYAAHLTVPEKEK